MSSRGSSFSAMSPARDVAFLGDLFKRFNWFDMFNKFSLLSEKMR
jgi:hypothetical protein